MLKPTIHYTYLIEQITISERSRKKDNQEFNPQLGSRTTLRTGSILAKRRLTSAEITVLWESIRTINELGVSNQIISNLNL